MLRETSVETMQRNLLKPDLYVCGGSYTELQTVAKARSVPLLRAFILALVCLKR